MTTDQVFCTHCLRVTDCLVQRVIDGWVWTCMDCDNVTDVDWIDNEYECE